MKNTGKIIIISAVLAICAGMATYFIVRQNKKSETIPETNTYISEKIEDECTEEYKEEQMANQNTTEVSSTEEKVAANAILILKKYYTKCDHTINEYVELPKELVNLTKEQVQEKYSDWEVIGFEKGKITLYKEFDDVCGEHYKIKDENGKINIYTIDRNGNESLYQKTDLSSEYLPEVDLLQIRGEGLEVDGKQELNKLIEDFE